MRDPDRRERILGLIRELWMDPQSCDIMLYQLLGNVTRVNGDPYNYEDAQLERALQTEVERRKAQP